MRSVLPAGASGYIGRAVAAELCRQGHRVVSLVRPNSAAAGALNELTEVREASVTDPASVADAIAGDRFDAVVSCLTSRTGVGVDAWRVDHGANANLRTEPAARISAR